MSSSELILDRQVRDWVLVPLTLSIVLMMVLRQLVTKLFSSAKPSNPAKEEELRQKAVIARSSMLRGSGTFITEAGFRQRKALLLAKDTGLLQQKVEKRDMQDLMVSNPDIMQGMLKQQMGGLVPQVAMGAFVSYFFSGFILGRVPFALSPKFRLMLQRGIDLPSLDPSYFTSLSYYILLLFGLRGVFSLAFRGDAIDDAAMMAQMQQAANPMGFDAAKAYEGERQALELVEHKWRLEGVEARAAATLAAQLKGGRPQ